MQLGLYRRLTNHLPFTPWRKKNLDVVCYLINFQVAFKKQILKQKKLKLKQEKSMPRTKGTKNAKFKSGIGLEMFQMLLDVLERKYKELGKAAAGSEAKDAACKEVLNAFKGRVDPKVYTDTKLRTSLSNTCIRVSRGPLLAMFISC